MKYTIQLLWYLHFRERYLYIYLFNNPYNYGETDPL